MCYKELLYNGYKLYEVWDMTIKELKQAIEPIIIKEKEVYQAQASFIYNLGALVGVAVNDPKKYPKDINSVFPTLFEPKKTIKMPEFLIDKAIKRGVI